MVLNLNKLDEDKSDPLLLARATSRDGMQKTALNAQPSMIEEDDSEDSDVIHRRHVNQYAFEN